MRAKQLSIEFPTIQEPTKPKREDNTGYTGIKRKYASTSGIGPYWMPRLGEVVRFYPEKGLVEIDGKERFVGSSECGLVLDMTDQMILVYCPEHSEFKWHKEWIAQVPASGCYPAYPGDFTEFNRRKINENVSAVFGFLTRPPATN